MFNKPEIRVPKPLQYERFRDRIAHCSLCCLCLEGDMEALSRDNFRISGGGGGGSTTTLAIQGRGTSKCQKLKMNFLQWSPNSACKGTVTTCFALIGLIAWKCWLGSTLRHPMYGQSVRFQARSLSWLSLLCVFFPPILRGQPMSGFSHLSLCRRLGGSQHQTHLNRSQAKLASWRPRQHHRRQTFSWVNVLRPLFSVCRPTAADLDLQGMNLTCRYRIQRVN